MRLINLHVDMRAVFVRGGLDALLLTAEGPVIGNAAPKEPSGLHLFFGQLESVMAVRVCWGGCCRGSTGREESARAQSTAHVWHHAVCHGSSAFQRPPCVVDHARCRVTDGTLWIGEWQAAVAGSGRQNQGIWPGHRQDPTIHCLVHQRNVGRPLSPTCLAKELDIWSEEHSFVGRPGPFSHDTAHILAAADQGVDDAHRSC